MLWTALIIIAPSLIFLKTAFDYIYPGQFKKGMIKIGWNAMELCSKTEIYVSGLYAKYVPTFLAKSPPPSMIKFIRDGNEIETYTLNEFLHLIKNDMVTTTYDFILHEVPIELKDNYEKYDKYVVRYENVNDVLRLEYNSLKCIEFNMMQITINETDNYAIDFGRNQYMVNGNVLFDRSFMTWYLNSHCNIKLREEDKYSITFMDHQMDFITLPDYCYILIKKNKYDIVNIIK